MKTHPKSDRKLDIGRARIEKHAGSSPKSTVQALMAFGTCCVHVHCWQWLQSDDYVSSDKETRGVLYFGATLGTVKLIELRKALAPS